MFPEISTSRFKLRQIIANDQSKIFEGLSHPDIIRYYGVSYTTYESTLAQMEFYEGLIANETGIWWAICLQHYPRELIGACGFNNLDRQHKNTEIGYWLLPAFQGSGIMAECLPCIITYAFKQLHLHRIEAVVEDANDKSIKLLTRLGFEYEGMRKECEIKNGAFISLHHFGVLNK